MHGLSFPSIRRHREHSPGNFLIMTFSSFLLIPFYLSMDCSLNPGFTSCPWQGLRVKYGNKGDVAGDHELPSVQIIH